MCGITGYVGSEESLPILSATLSNLEYRGYDSAGIALSGSALEIYKQEGTIDELDLPEHSNSTLGIGHTRWSTHGEPTDANAHPHTDCTGSIAVVHNGIIENYDALKSDLLASHEFTSETDTEVIPHLLEDALEDHDSLPQAVEAVLEMLEGSFAIAVITDDHRGIVAARQDSPLVIGKGSNGNFLASDVPAFIERTRDVIYLEDGDVAWITDDAVEIYNEGTHVERQTNRIEWDAEAAEKGGYEHYMLKEIHEQPQALRQALTGRLDEMEGTVDLELNLDRNFLQNLDEVQFTAAGTSYHAGVYARHLFESLAGVRATTHIASEYEFRGGRDPSNTLVIGITQSGETADTLQAIRRAKSAGSKTLALTNTVGSTVTREVSDSVYIKAGPEIGVAATKTFVSQVATLTMLAVEIGRIRGTLSGAEASTILENLRRLPGAIQQVLDEEDRIREVAESYATQALYFFIGRQLGHPVALEGALKLKEISYAHAEGFPAGELKHGPLALVTSDSTVIAVLTAGSNPEETLHNVKEVDSRGASVIGLTSDRSIEKFLDESFSVPDIGRLEPVVANVYMQLLAYYIARANDRPIDKPRNLAKSVTVK